MAKRPRFSRWRRLPPVFRTGEHRPIGTGNELDRIILYLPARLARPGRGPGREGGDPRDPGLLRAVAEPGPRGREGPAEGHRIRGPSRAAGGPEGDRRRTPITWRSGRAGIRRRGRPPCRPPPVDAITVDFVLADRADARPTASRAAGGAQGDRLDRGRRRTPGRIARRPGPPPIRVRRDRRTAARPTVRLAANRTALEVLWRHLGFGGDDSAFLPCLRRGVPSPRPGRPS